MAKKPSKPLTQEHVGMRFGRLVVQQEFFKRRPSGTQLRWWLCLCDCGKTAEVVPCYVKAGRTRSCGCLWFEAITTHRMSKNSPTAIPEYGIWISMIQRCTNPKEKSFKNYGGRGIAVCDRWRHSFENFLCDMGRRPSLKHTIERRDNDLGYSPDNCYWEIYGKQSRNRRNNHMIAFDGVTMCLQDWANQIGIHQVGLLYRLKRWPLGRALTTAPTPNMGRPRVIKKRGA